MKLSLKQLEKFREEMEKLEGDCIENERQMEEKLFEKTKEIEDPKLKLMSHENQTRTLEQDRELRNEIDSSQVILREEKARGDQAKRREVELEKVLIAKEEKIINQHDEIEELKHCTWDQSGYFTESFAKKNVLEEVLNEWRIADDCCLDGIERNSKNLREEIVEQKRGLMKIKSRPRNQDNINYNRYIENFWMEESLNSDKAVQVGDRVDPSNIKKKEDEYGNHFKNFSSGTYKEREATIRKELERLKAD
ncbi:hypothetical protein HHI36_001217 [Cryptolaemus montrouzieri]|uniref:Uncharacterized protein n=1 Tax=Cryptolaemus montrouzieri TaxID=559131 RepID=A0ABD2P7Q7_9CUCU